jgi:hypothetical protein
LERHRIFGGCPANTGNFCSSTQISPTADLIAGFECEVEVLGASLLYFPLQSTPTQSPAKAEESPKVVTLTTVIFTDHERKRTLSISEKWATTSPTVYMAYATISAEFVADLQDRFGEPHNFCLTTDKYTAQMLSQLQNLTIRAVTQTTHGALATVPPTCFR